MKEKFKKFFAPTKFKRLFDIVVSFFALIILSPLFLVICIANLLTPNTSVFFSHERRGRKGKPFKIYKFQTMKNNTPNVATGDLENPEQYITKVGKFLRKTKLNELPQLINIFIGNMSIIGPRPLMQCDFDAYSQEAQSHVIESKPGLSGIGSIVFRDEEVIVSRAKEPVAFFMQVIQPFKGQLEIWYHEHRSLWVDTMIVFLTVWVVLFPKSELVYKVFPSLPKKDLERAVEEFNEGLETRD